MTAMRHDNPPAPQVENKPSSMTANKRAVLQCLDDLGANFLKRGTPPYALSQLAEQIGQMCPRVLHTSPPLKMASLPTVCAEGSEAITLWSRLICSRLDQTSVHALHHKSYRSLSKPCSMHPHFASASVCM